jgi:iduronate 2-sulfatase
MPRPNVLFIAVDDLRPELGCYGASQVQSPNFDALATESVRFSRAYCQSPVCNPSRASVLTGMRPDTHGVFDLYTHFRTNLPEVVTLPQHFMANGYHAAAVGKIFHNDLPDPKSWSEPRELLPGFPFDPDAVYVEADNLTYLEERKAQIRAAGRQDDYIDPLGEWYFKASASEATDFSDDAYYDGAQTSHAINKLRSLAEMDRPFFFGVGYYRPHLPFNAPKRYWDLYDRESILLADNPRPPLGAPHMALNNLRELRGYRDFADARHPCEGQVSEADARLLKHGYLASVSYLDAQIGRLLGEVDALGIRDNTIVALWVDHGYKLGEHGSWCKMTNYETDTRVPLFVSAPGYQRDAVCDGLVETLDLYPTLCELCNLPVGDHLEGQSIVSQLSDPNAPAKDAVFSQFYRAGIWQDPDGRDYLGCAIRSDSHRYVEWFDCETSALLGRELYDHRVDPGETVNIVESPTNGELVAALAQRLENGLRLPRSQASDASV